MRVDRVVLEGLARIYRDLDADLTELGASCATCGDCCQLASFGHEVWLTNLELALLVAAVGARAPIDPGVCPYLKGGRCAAHAARALSCRVFHCDLDQASQERLHERYLARILSLANEHLADQSYGELLASLDALTRAAKRDQSGSKPLTSE